MALFTRLRSLCIYGKCVRFTFVPRSYFNSLSRAPSGSPPTGSRSYIGVFRKRTRRDMMEADNVPEHFDMIYRNTMGKYIYGSQIVIGVTAGLVLFAIIMKQEDKDPRRNTVEWSPTAKPVESEELYYILIFTVLVTLVHVMALRTPIRIYKVPKTSKYVVVNYGHYFFGREKYSFHSGQLHRGDQTGILPWSENRYVIETETNHRPVLLVEYFFRKPADLHIMLGEQKDLDLEEEEKKKM